MTGPPRIEPSDPTHESNSFLPTRQAKRCIRRVAPGLPASDTVPDKSSATVLEAITSEYSPLADPALSEVFVTVLAREIFVDIMNAILPLVRELPGLLPHLRSEPVVFIESGLLSFQPPALRESLRVHFFAVQTFCQNAARSIGSSLLSTGGTRPTRDRSSLCFAKISLRPGNGFPVFSSFFTNVR